MQQTAKESIYTIAATPIAFTLVRESTTTASRHFLASVFAYMKVCNNGFFTQVGRVGPNAGWHKEFWALATL